MPPKPSLQSAESLPRSGFSTEIPAFGGGCTDMEIDSMAALCRRAARPESRVLNTDAAQASGRATARPPTPHPTPPRGVSAATGSSAAAPAAQYERRTARPPFIQPGTHDDIVNDMLQALQFDILYRRWQAGGMGSTVPRERNQAINIDGAIGTIAQLYPDHDRRLLVYHLLLSGLEASRRQYGFEVEINALKLHLLRHEEWGSTSSARLAGPGPRSKKARR